MEGNGGGEEEEQEEEETYSGDDEDKASNKKKKKLKKNKKRNFDFCLCFDLKNKLNTKYFRRINLKYFLHYTF